MAPGTARRCFLSHHQPEKQRFQPGPQPPEVLWHLPRAAGLQAGRRREAPSFLSPSAGGCREHGVARAGSARSAAWGPRPQPRVGTRHQAGLSPPASRHPHALGALRCQPSWGFSLSSRPLTPPELRNTPGYCLAPFSAMGTPGPPGRCGASEGSVPPPSPPRGSICAPGFGSRSLGGPAEPAGLPGEPSPGLELELSPKRGSSAQPLCQGSSGHSLPWRGAPSHRHSPAPAGRERPGAPLLGNVGAFWAEGSLSESSPCPPRPSQSRSFGSGAAAPSPPARTGADGEEWKGMDEPWAWILHP